MKGTKVTCSSRMALVVLEVLVARMSSLHFFSQALIVEPRIRNTVQDKGHRRTTYTQQWHAQSSHVHHGSPSSSHSSVSSHSSRFAPVSISFHVHWSWKAFSTYRKRPNTRKAKILTHPYLLTINNHENRRHWQQTQLVSANASAAKKSLS